jgi:plastocyanin
MSCRALSPLTLAVALALPAAGWAHALSGSVELLAKGGRVADRTADVRNAVVVYRPRAAPKAHSTNPSFSMVTRKKEFAPRVLAVPVGATGGFPNEDPILHNVFSVSGDNRFDLGLYRQGPGKSWAFKSPGVVRVFCNVHHSMVAYVYVADSPFFSSPDAAGRFVLSGLPAGAGTLEVWHEQTEGWSREMAARETGPVNVRLEVTKPRLPSHLNKLGRPYARVRGDY